MDQYKALATFVQAATLGSFGKAAVKLGITQQQASKNIRQLEEFLGARLFNRTTRSVSLTDEGQRFFAEVGDGMSRLEQAVADVQSGADEAQGVVRMTTPKALAQSVVVPLLAEFRQLNPRITIELIVDDEMTDLVAQRIDAGIRAGTLRDGRLVARKLVPIQHIVCAAPAYLEKHGMPRDIESLAQFDCTAFRHVNTGKIWPWEFMIDGHLTYRDMPSAFLANDVEAECAAVLSGLGIGQLASFSAVPHILENRLVPLFLETMTERFWLYLYYPGRRHLSRRVRLLLDFLSERLKNNPKLFLSPSELHNRLSPGNRKTRGKNVPEGSGFGDATAVAPSARSTHTENQDVDNTHSIDRG